MDYGEKTDFSILKHETILILLISFLAPIEHYCMSGTKHSPYETTFNVY
jgi:hypothetical protein